MRVKTYWLFGISGAGKTTIAQAWVQQWKSLGEPVVLLDEEALKIGLNSDLNAAAILKEEPTRRIAELAKLLNQRGITVIVSAITPLNAQRQLASQIVGPKLYTPIWIDSPVQICQRRDPKGLYVKALSNRLKFFPGVNAPFENPDTSLIKVSTDQFSVSQCVELIFKSIK